MVDSLVAMSLRCADDPFFVAHAMRERFGPDWFAPAGTELNLTPPELARLSLCRRPETAAEVARLARRVGIEPARLDWLSVK